jgi:hypothetical protein
MLQRLLRAQLAYATLSNSLSKITRQLLSNITCFETTAPPNFQHRFEIGSVSTYVAGVCGCAEGNDLVLSGPIKFALRIAFFHKRDEWKIRTALRATDVRVIGITMEKNPANTKLDARRIERFRFIQRALPKASTLGGPLTFVSLAIKSSPRNFEPWSCPLAAFNASCRSCSQSPDLEQETTKSAKL